MNNENDTRPWITIFPDHPRAFAWFLPPCNESELDSHVGHCCGDLLPNEWPGEFADEELPMWLTIRFCEWMDKWTEFDMSDRMSDDEDAITDEERAIDDEGQRLVAHGVECAVETLVVLIFQSAWSLSPQRLYIINNVILVGINLLAVLPFGLLTEGYRYSHKLAVLVEQALELELIEKLLAVVIDIEDDVRSVLLALCVVDLVSW